VDSGRPGGHERILVVDDEPGIQRTAERLLRRLGYDVLVASDSEEAIEKAKAMLEPADLLFTDLVLPGTPGTDLARRIVDMWPGVKVLFTSGWGEAEILSRPGVPEGASVLSKPYSLDELAHKVRQTLDAA
jgi:CheY-like chemotaxis protein